MPQLPVARSIPVGADPTTLPVALSDLHRAVDVGQAVHVTLAAHHASERVMHLFIGAGFIDVVVATGTNARTVTVHATRARSLADSVGAGMRLLVVGLNPSLYAADADIGRSRHHRRRAEPDQAPAELWRRHDRPGEAGQRPGRRADDRRIPLGPRPTRRSLRVARTSGGVFSRPRGMAGRSRAHSYAGVADPRGRRVPGVRHGQLERPERPRHRRVVGRAPATCA